MTQSKEFNRRNILRGIGVAAAAAGISQLVSSKSQGLEKKLVAPKATGLPTVGPNFTLSGEFFHKGIYSPEDALKIIESFPDKKKQLDQRAVALTVAWMRNEDREVLAQKRELYQDWHIFKYLAPGQ